jgi:ferredoxin-type protein NapH
MSAKRHPGREARMRHGWLGSSRWLLARRLAQLGFLALFASGPWLGVWITKGTLASSLTLDLLPLTDPLVLLQSLLARHRPEATAVVGAGIVLAAYLVLGGRLYCSWVCPVNPVSDLAAWARRRLGIEASWRVRPAARYWALGGVLAAAALTGTIAFELLNPITTLHRGLLFGVSWGMMSIAVIFLFDLLVARHGWCGHVCPVGAFYGLLNRASLLRVSAAGRARCDDCMDCYAVCPEMHVIAPALKGARTGAGPIIAAADCTACGRCIDVCPHRVFRFTHRFDDRVEATGPETRAAGASPHVAPVASSA